MELAVVDGIALAGEETCTLGALGQLHGAVVADVQRLGRVADGWAVRRGVPANHEQQLVQ